MSEQEAGPTTGWIQRHGKWLFAAACLGATIVAINFAYIIFSVLMGELKSSDPYQQALASLRADPRAIEALGEPIEAGLLVIGHIEHAGTQSRADLAIPVSGPTGSGKLFVVALLEGENWVRERFELQVEGREEPVDLRPLLP